MKLQEALKSKYNSDDTRIKKYVCGRCFSFKMTDDKLILEQVHEHEIVWSEISGKDMIFLSQLFTRQIVAFMVQLQHKEKDFKLEKLIDNIKIKEYSRI